MEEKFIMKFDDLIPYRGILSKRLDLAVQNKDVDLAKELDNVISTVDTVIDTGYYNFISTYTGDKEMNTDLNNSGTVKDNIFTDGNTGNIITDNYFITNSSNTPGLYSKVIKNSQDIQDYIIPVMKENFTSNFDKVISIYREKSNDFITSPDIIWRALVNCYGKPMHKSWHKYIVNMTYKEPLEAFYCVKSHAKSWSNEQIVNFIKGLVSEEVYGETAKLDINHKMNYSNDLVLNVVLDNEELRRKIASVYGIGFDNDNPTISKLIDIAKKDKNYFNDKFLSHLKTRKEYIEEGYPV